MNDSLKAKRDELAEKYSFSNGTAHTLRTEPAWHYSQLDFKQGFDAAVKLLSEELAAREAEIEEMRKSLNIVAMRPVIDSVELILCKQELNKWKAMALELGEAVKSYGVKTWAERRVENINTVYHTPEECLAAIERDKQKEEFRVLRLREALAKLEEMK